MAVLTASISSIPTLSAEATNYNINDSSTLEASNEITSSAQAKVNLVDSTIKSTAANLQQTEVEILESKGWLESASVEWSPVSGANGYNVYYKSQNESDSNYKQLDNELIRQYGSYFRADVLGLSAGNYFLKVVPIINGNEDTSEAAITEKISVKKNVREGFAFSAQSPMGTGSGGYNNDGTIASNAKILYITADNVNTVTLDVITNSKGAKTTCTGIVDILAKRQKGYDKTPLIIRMIGQIKGTDINGINSSGYLQIKGSYNTTFEGVGEDATVYGWGFLVRDSHNVEIRNVGIMLFPDDAVSLDTDNENIWVHNNDFFYGAAGSDADQVKGDGSCDVKGHSTYVTVSYNHFYDSGKSSLCGMSDTEEFFVTYHHNWFDHSDSRHPRIRVGTVHIYNNYFDGNSKYGVGVTKGSSAFVEANYFRNSKYPMLISLQGTDIYSNSKGTFSGEEGGMIKAYNNKIENPQRLIYSNEDATQFDAYLATSRNEVVQSTYKTISGGNVYNNFDTSSSMYNYNPDSPEDVEDVVTAYAGRGNGGDFIWDFTDEDDSNYTLDTQLMAKIKNYTSDLVSVGGNSVSDTIEDSDKEENGNTGNDESSTETSTSHNFTTDGTSNAFFNITGYLSTSKGTVEYNGLTLTQCLKVESATNIAFKTTKTSTLTLVFNSDFNGNILVDGTKYKATNGIANIELSAGSHTIKKSDSCNLYYIGLEY